MFLSFLYILNNVTIKSESVKEAHSLMFNFIWYSGDSSSFLHFFIQPTKSLALLLLALLVSFLQSEQSNSIAIQNWHKALERVFLRLMNFNENVNNLMKYILCILYIIYQGPEKSLMMGEWVNFYEKKFSLHGRSKVG